MSTEQSQDARLGTPVPNWAPPPTPPASALEGRYVRLEPLSADHAEPLFEAYRVDDSTWDYLPYGPFADPDALRAWVDGMVGLADPMFFAMRDRATGEVGGVASYLRVTPNAGTIEVGHIHIARGMQRSVAATEAMFLMMDRAFSAGYRRYEWKCNALNRASRRAAQRLGFSFEGVFRQAAVIKGRNRDTAWFAITDGDWPPLREAFRAWLAPDNFERTGVQRRSLSTLTGPHLHARDPMLGP